METERCVMRVRSEETGSQTDLVHPRVEEEEEEEETVRVSTVRG